MKDNISFETLKDEDSLVKFLERVWQAGFKTARVGGNIADMPKFKEKLSVGYNR
jgi:hypothetical protein